MTAGMVAAFVAGALTVWAAAVGLTLLFFRGVARAEQDRPRPDHDVPPTLPAVRQ